MHDGYEYNFMIEMYSIRNVNKHDHYNAMFIYKNLIHQL